MLCKPNSTAKPSRSVRIIANVLNACCTAANAFRNVHYLYNISDSIPTNTNIEQMYVYASERSERA